MGVPAGTSRRNRGYPLITVINQHFHHRSNLFGAVRAEAVAVQVGDHPDAAQRDEMPRVIASQGTLSAPVRQQYERRLRLQTCGFQEETAITLVPGRVVENTLGHAAHLLLPSQTTGQR
jgi:hypothetical protein